MVFFRYFYIKKRTDTNDYLSVPEIELYDASNNNVARYSGVVASARTTYNNNTSSHGPQLAINGTYIGGHNNGYSSNLSNDEWLKIDLLQQYDIRKVRVYINFQSEYFLQPRLSNALLIGSNDGTNNALTDSSLRYWSGQMPSINITTYPNTNYMGSTYLDFSVTPLPLLNRWVAVGSGINDIIYSDNGTSWTGLGVSIFSGAGHGVASNGTMWVAVGEGSSNTMGYSTNGGASWTGLGTTMFQSGAYGIASNGTMWVAGGNGTNNTLAYSSDGITWNGLGKTIFSTSVAGIATNGTMWVASGSGTNTLAYSYNGTSWTGIGSSILATPRGGICWFNDKWIVAGDASIAYSSNGINWTKVSPSFITPRAWGVGTNGVMCIVMCEGTSSMGYSNDGITWTGLGNTIFTSRGRGVAWNGSKWIAVGEGTNCIAWSNDGINWTGLGHTLFTSAGRFVAPGTYIGQVIPTISFSIPTKTFGTDISFNLAPSSNSTGAFTFTSSNTAVATISGSTVTIVGAGSATITATQAASGNYSSGSATATLTVAQANPTISFSIPAKTFGTDISFNLAPGSNSTGAFSYSSFNTAVATISGSTVTIVGAGSSTITLTQAATTNYLSATRNAILNVAQANPTISFNIPPKTFGTDISFNLAPGSNSTGAFSYTSSNTSVATISGSRAIIVGAGSSTITATQDASGNYLSATVTSELTVSLASPTITFNNIDKIFGDMSFNLVPASNSNGAFYFTSSDTSVASISGSTVTILKVGTSTITAMQDASGNYLSKTVTTLLTVNQAIPTITFNIPVQTFGTPAFNLNPITNSNGAITFTSSDTSVATVFNSTVTILKAGTTTINLVQDASGNYLQGTSSAVLTVNKVVTLLSGFSNIEKSFADIFVLEYVSNSDGALSYVISDPSIATIFGSTVTCQKVGTTTITVTQAETENYFQETLSFVLTVNKANPSLSGFNDFIKIFNDEPFDLTIPTSLSSGAFTFTSSDNSVATILGITVTIIGAGSATITATQETTDDYLQDSITCLLTVNKASPMLSNFNDVVKTYGDEPFIIIPPTSLSTGAFTYSSSNSSRAIVVDDVLTIVSSGVIAIIATQEETNNYLSETTYSILRIYKINTILTNFNDILKTYGDGDFDLLEPQSSRLGIYTYVSSDESVAIIVNNTVSIRSGGITEITAIQDETEFYKPGLISCILKVNQINSTLNYIDVLLIDGNTHKVIISTNSDGLFSYAVSDSTIVTVNSDNTLSFLQPGDVTIVATQAETATYYSGEFSTVVSYTGA